MEKQNETEGKLSKLPACAAEFIKLIIKKMRYRRKVREDVQAELAVHFEDELKGIKTEADREEKAKQLVGGFGDVKLLAILLHRAKKRCRPLWRTLFARACQAIVILFVCLVLYVVWFLTGKPVITTNYVAELNRMVRPVADESLNAAPLYTEAAKMFEDIPRDILELLGKKYNEVTAEEKRLIKKWLTDNEEALELVISGTQKPYYWEKYRTGRNSGEMISVLIPHLNEFRNLARSLCWRAQLRAEQGRYEDAFADLKSCYRFGQHLKGDKSLIEQLVGIAIENLAAQALRSILSQHRIDSATLANLQQDLGQLIAGEKFTPNLEMEKMFLYDEIQRSFTDGPGGGHIIPRRINELSSDVCIIAALSESSAVSSPEKQEPGWLSKFISNVRNEICELGELIYEAGSFAKKGGYVLFLHPDKQQTREMTDRFYAFCDVIAQKTPAQIRAERIDVEKETMEIIKDNVLLAILTPALGRVSEINHWNKTDVRATVTVLSLLRYKADKGSYPKDLQELITASYLEELPMDPYSDKPLVYKRIGDDFTLYSLGEDFDDDGGQAGRDEKGKLKKTWRGDDAVFWPVPKSQVK